MCVQNPKDKRQIIIDDKLGTIFKPPLTMFSMNKQLTKHVFKACEYCTQTPIG
jgi:upstream activation factor subunit UAF30